MSYRDARAAQIADYLKRGLFSKDALKRIAYCIQAIENEGELEIFISDEIDKAAKENP